MCQQEKFIEIGNAFETLSDPDSRRLYDRSEHPCTLDLVPARAPSFEHVLRSNTAQQQGVGKFVTPK